MAGVQPFMTAHIRAKKRKKGKKGNSASGEKEKLTNGRAGRMM